jgi:mono/diheme cytochrome c family protein
MISVKAGRATILAAVMACVSWAAQADSNADLERGRYLVKVTGCNDCHTRDYATKGGQVPEREWLTGDVLGWRGPWGTTYPTNLRLYFASLSEDEWVRRAKRLRTRPPMPWFNVREMSEEDLRNIYRFVHALGPPRREPAGPVITFPSPSPGK